MAKTPEEYAHIEWLGYVQPVGLVVSIPAMVEAQCYINRNVIPEHNRFLGCLLRDPHEAIIPEISDLPLFTRNVLGWEAEDLIPLSAVSCPVAVRERFTIALPQYNEVLRPTHVVFEFAASDTAQSTDKQASGTPLMLVQEVATGISLDEPTEADSARHWNAAPQAKFERLLRETEVPIGLMSNGRQLRLVFAPRGESSGFATFNVDEMAQVAGRPLFAALHMLLCADRMFSMSSQQRLPAILVNSRKYQNTVSTKLAEQVLAALYELMRGFQAADDVRKGDLLREILARDPNHVYGGLLRVMMRLVFIMYAEDRDLLSSDPIYSNYYSVTGLFNRLREDAGRHPDSMNQRFGAWSQLITLFRLIYEGGQHDDFRLPPRSGYLFDPERYPFLEGRAVVVSSKGLVIREDGQTNLTTNHQQLTTTMPRISDGVVFNVLKNLLILDGERLSYRTLDVEQIGSVYETVMGFNLEVAAGRSIAIKPVKSHGAPATINLEDLLATKGSDRAKWLKENADQTLGTAAAKPLKDASTIEELLTALDKKIAKKVTPRIVPAGAIVLQPSDERRRSGSHYTPRSLTEPIVRTTLEPILKQLVTHPDNITQPQGVSPGSDSADKTGANAQRLTETTALLVNPRPIDKQLQKRLTKAEIAERERLEQKKADNYTAAIRIGTPHPSQILDLKICDPAMGSGAFLVEACRQLGDELIAAWYAHDAVPTDIPPDEDEVLYARRLIAQRCLYGVDKNAMAVDLAKLSLWLVTLAKDHAFTFLDHALRHGDSLVGLTREQIIGFHWDVKQQKKFGEDLIQRRLDRATEARAKILNAREDVPYRDQQQRKASADEALDLIRLVGDACVSGFFAGQKKKEREEEVERLFGVASCYLESLTAGRGKQVDFESRRVLGQAAARLRAGSHPIPAFHWEIEFPEVFARENGGFDAFVGNPPFAGKNTLIASSHDSYPDWLKAIHVLTSGNADLVSHFFRRAFAHLRSDGTLGLIATNTVGQGDTRQSGLMRICLNGGSIYSAQRRYRWPGQAAVVVSVVHIAKSDAINEFTLDSKKVSRINSYLFTSGPDTPPATLKQNANIAFKGGVVMGQGFVFPNDPTEENAGSPEDALQLLSVDPRNADVVWAYIAGGEINQMCIPAPERYIINFGEMPVE